MHALTFQLMCEAQFLKFDSNTISYFNKNENLSKIAILCKCKEKAYDKKQFCNMNVTFFLK